MNIFSDIPADSKNPPSKQVQQRAERLNYLMEGQTVDIDRDFPTKSAHEDTLSKNPNFVKEVVNDFLDNTLL